MSKISIKPESWDFGKITELKILSRDFEVSNTGNDVLTIKNITTSCGCTTVSISSKDITISWNLPFFAHFIQIEKVGLI